MSYWERLTHLKLMSLQRRRERYIIITMWKILNGKHPNNMIIQFQHPKRNGITALDSLSSINYAVENTTQCMTPLLQYMQGPKLWKLLPAGITQITDLEIFKICLYDEFLSKKSDSTTIQRISLCQL